MRWNRQGAVLIETALMFLAFLMLIFSGIELGRAWFTYNLVTHAVREGTRAASVKPGLAPDDGEIVSLVQSILDDANVAATETTVRYVQPLRTGGFVRVTSQVDFAPVIGLWTSQSPLIFPMTVSMVTRYEI